MKKIVNGIEVDLSSSEALAILQEWQREDERKETYKATVKYKDDRKNEYPKIDDLIVALWEKVIEGRDNSANALQSARSVIKDKYPKTS